MPLLEKEELDYARGVKLGGQFRAQQSERVRFAAADFAGPLVPATAVMTLAVHLEQDEVLKPPAILIREAKEFLAGFASRVAKKPRRRFPEQGKLVGRYGFIIDLRGL